MAIYRVIEDLEAGPHERFQVQSSIFGHTWTTCPNGKFADQISAEIDMERRAAGPRVVAVSTTTGGSEG